jgi:hypothetical protein
MNNRLGKMLQRRKEEHGRKLRGRRLRKKEIDGEILVSR